jgi:hypothetical protein
VNNRKPITIRLNLQQQQMMSELRQFWSLDDKAVVWLALQQLYIASQEVEKKKREAAAQAAQEKEQCETPSSDSSSSPSSSSPSESAG